MARRTAPATWEEADQCFQWARELSEIATELLEALKNADLPAGTYYPSMLIGFLCKQSQHMEAALALERRRDAALVARSMIEGMCLLLWTAKDAETRAHMWSDFGFVHDWRVVRERVRSGDHVDSRLSASVEEGARTHGQQFLRKPKKGETDGDLLSDEDPFIYKWTGLSVAKIFDDVGQGEKYETFFSQFSDWHHWNAGGVKAALVTRGREVTYHPTDPQVSLSAFVNAIQALFETLVLAEKHFDVGFTARLEDYRDRYLADRQSYLDEEEPSAVDAQAG